MKNVDRIKKLSGRRILLIVKGFEETVSNAPEDILTRFGHDWDQDIVEDAKNTDLGKLYNGMGKHLVIVTTIGFSSGRNAYEKAVKTACASDFKGGIVELEGPHKFGFKLP